MEIITSSAGSATLGDTSWARLTRCLRIMGGEVKQPHSHTKGTLIEEKRLVLYCKSDFMKFRPGAKYSLASFLGHIFLGHLCVQWYIEAL